MFLEIITPEKKLFSGDTEMVRLPGTAGSFEVLQHHAPIVSTLMEGKIKVKETNGNFVYFDISGGVVEALNNNIIILADAMDSID